MSSLPQSKERIHNSLGQLISIAENYAGKNGQKIDRSVFEDSMKVYLLIEGNSASGDLMNSLANLFDRLSQVFEKGVNNSAEE